MFDLVTVPSNIGDRTMSKLVILLSVKMVGWQRTLSLTEHKDSKLAENTFTECKDSRLAENTFTECKENRLAENTY